MQPHPEHADGCRGSFSQIPPSTPHASPSRSASVIITTHGVPDRRRPEVRRALAAGDAVLAVRETAERNAEAATAAPGATVTATDRLVRRSKDRSERSLGKIERAYLGESGRIEARGSAGRIQ